MILHLSPLVSWLVVGGALTATTVWVVRRSKARSQRLFVDEPNRILATLHRDHSHTHELDGL